MAWASLLLPLVVSPTLVAVAAASPAPAPEIPADLTARALPDGPSGNYTPAYVDCPSDRPAARTADSLSPKESSWLSLRRNNTLDPLIAFLEAANISGFNATSYISGVLSASSSSSTRMQNVPNIGIAVSGGGYRALMNGAGFLAAADSRTPNQPANGSISGLLQASTYLAGLSGGGWLVGSMFANNFSSVVALRDGYEGSNVWRFDNSIFSGPSSDAQDSGSTTPNTKRRRDVDLSSVTENLQILDTAEYWTDVAHQVSGKADSGFQTSLTDYWGRVLSYQLINAPFGGLDYTFSSIAETADFINAQTPFPLIVADARAPNTTIIALNATVYEFGAFEMGSWDPTTYGFVPTRYLGSNFTNGVVPQTNESHCVRGFDQFGYVMGTSSSLFNQFLLNNISSVVDMPSFVITLIEGLLNDIGEDNNDIAQYVPNPFWQYRPDSNPSATDLELSLVDGGEDLQNLPLHPLIQPVRAVDVILAVDSSADTDYYWPNGTALRASYDRSRGDTANGTLFPPVPDDNTFVNLGLNQRPTFFGCNASNFTLSGSQTVPPLVVYLPNAPYTLESNFSTFTMTYTLEERNNIIENGFNVATQGNGTVNADWPACLACAVLSRSFDRTATTVPAACTACFTKYCWDGTLNTTAAAAYEPTFFIGNADTASSSAAPAKGRALPSALVAATSASLLLALLF